MPYRAVSPEKQIEELKAEVASLQEDVRRLNGLSYGPDAKWLSWWFFAISILSLLYLMSAPTRQQFARLETRVGEVSHTVRKLEYRCP